MCEDDQIIKLINAEKYIKGCIGKPHIADAVWNVSFWHNTNNTGHVIITTMLLMTIDDKFACAKEATIGLMPEGLDSRIRELAYSLRQAVLEHYEKATRKDS